MDPSKLSTVRRGKFDQLRYDGKYVEIPFENVKITRNTRPKIAGGGAYDKFTRIDIARALGSRADLLLVHRYIDSKAKPDFSPLKYAAESGSWGDVVCKIKTDRHLSSGDIVSGKLSPGAFSKFGWCLTLTVDTFEGSHPR